MITKACGLYNINIVILNAFPSPEQATLWAKEAWATVCREAQKQFSDDDSEQVHTLVRYNYLIHSLAINICTDSEPNC